MTIALTLASLAATIIIGPLVFYLLSAFYHKHPRELRFPATAKGAIGDIVMLPFFNARAAYLLVGSVFTFSSTRIVVAIGLALAASAGYIVYRAYLYPKWYGNNTWMDGHSSLFNLLGWYHVWYFVLQSGIILYVLISFPVDTWLWTFLVGYVLTAIIGQFQIARGRWGVLSLL